MKRVIESWNIAILGSWNVAILSPQWLGVHNIFSPEQEISVEVSFIPNHPARFTCEGVRIIPSANRLVIAPTSATDDVLLRAESVACQILELLGHTPVVAIGINFGFLEEDIDTELSKHFEDNDSGIFADAGFRTGQRTQKRQLIQDDQIINLSIELNNQEAKFDFNFHTNTDSTAQAVLAIKNKVLRNRDIALKILDDVYSTTLEDE